MTNLGGLLTTPTGPLAGFLVADFTQILAGPFCTQMLADAGATVIKIEQPGGEHVRVRGSRRFNDVGDSMSSYCVAVNRGKRSMCLDLKNAEGLRIAKELIAQADVVIENFRPGVFDQLGLGLSQLRAERPELVTCSISLFGGLDSAGEEALRGGVAIIAEAESGCSGMQRKREGTGFPLGSVGLGFPLGDTSSGMAAYGGIVTALLNRERTGLGQHIDISMVKACLSLNAASITQEDILAGREVEAREVKTAGYGMFPASDGYVALGVNTDGLFERFAKAMGMEWLANDERYALFTERDQRVDEVNEIIGKWSSTLTMNEIVSTVSSFGVPCGLVATPRDILDSPTIANLGFLEEVGDGLGGVVRVPTNPMGFRQPTSSVPRVNQHTEEVMAERLGADSATYRELVELGAFGEM